jgi:hypothetical protein
MSALEITARFLLYVGNDTEYELASLIFIDNTNAVKNTADVKGEGENIIIISEV